MLFSIPTKASEKGIYYAAVIIVEREQLKTHMGDFFERRYEGYQEACSDLLDSCAAGILVMNFDAALEHFSANPQEALDYLIENYPNDFTTKRALDLKGAKNANSTTDSNTD